MIIRYLTPDDVPEHDKVSSQAFVFSCDINDPASVLPSKLMLGAFADDNKTLFADMEIYERTCNFDGGFLSCAAVGGVAAKPEHRGKGAVKAMFDRLFSENRYDISILYPFSEAYYRKLGYERAGVCLSATVPFSELADFKRNQDATLYEGAGEEKLLGIYNRCAAAHNLSFVRETAEAYSAQPYFSKSYTYIWKENAYVTLSVDREKSTVFVKEILFDSPASMRGVLGFLRNFEGNQKRVCFQSLPADSPLLCLFRELKACDISVHSIGAVRILNVEKVLAAHRYKQTHGGFTVQIGGDKYRVALSDGGASVERDTALLPDAVMDLPRASQLLLCGFTNPAYLPDVEIRNPDSDFFRLFPPKTSFFNDEF